MHGPDSNVYPHQPSSVAEYAEGNGDRGSTSTPGAYKAGTYIKPVNDDEWSFAGKYDYRIKPTEVAAALGVAEADLCLGCLVTNKEPTPKTYTDVCCCPTPSDFGSAIHTKTIALRSKFHDLDLIDKSRAGQADDDRKGKGEGKGKGKGKKGGDYKRQRFW